MYKLSKGFTIIFYKTSMKNYLSSLLLTSSLLSFLFQYRSNIDFVLLMEGDMLTLRTIHFLKYSEKCSASDWGKSFQP